MYLAALAEFFFSLVLSPPLLNITSLLVTPELLLASCSVYTFSILPRAGELSSLIKLTSENFGNVVFHF